MTHHPKTPTELIARLIIDSADSEAEVRSDNVNDLHDA